MQSGIHWGLAIVNSELSAHDETKRYPILDALRFALAFWVVMDHFGEFPLFANADTSVPAVWLLSHSHATIVCGIAAVMVFCHSGLLHSSSIPNWEDLAARAILRATPRSNPDSRSCDDNPLPFFDEPRASLRCQAHVVKTRLIPAI